MSKISDGIAAVIGLASTVYICIVVGAAISTCNESLQEQPATAEAPVVVLDTRPKWQHVKAANGPDVLMLHMDVGGGGTLITTYNNPPVWVPDRAPESTR